MFVEARLYKDNPYAKAMWTLAQNIKNSGDNRSLGFSIEGAIKSRNTEDERVIEELIVRNVAITTHPANPHATWEAFVKSWSTGHGTTSETQVDGGALRREELINAVTTISSIQATTTAEDLNRLWHAVSEHIDTNEEHKIKANTILLQLSRGVSKEHAESFLKL